MMSREGEKMETIRNFVEHMRRWDKNSALGIQPISPGENGSLASNSIADKRLQVEIMAENVTSQNSDIK